MHDRRDENHDNDRGEKSRSPIHATGERELRRSAHTSRPNIPAFSCGPGQPPDRAAFSTAVARATAAAARSCNAQFGGELVTADFHALVTPSILRSRRPPE